jgi:hypothetical protein
MPVNSESNPTLSTKPEERANNRLCTVASLKRRTEEDKLLIAHSESEMTSPKHVQDFALGIECLLGRGRDWCCPDPKEAIGNYFLGATAITFIWWRCRVIPLS